ncbi:MAG: alpha/beta hydrolase [Cytophagales bacterium]|nr:alpha/beta hydrolase [Cytophagales bacterium]
MKEYYQPSEQYMVETIFGKTFVIESGSKTAPAIVLLHGTGSNSAMWIADAKELSAKYHVFAIDIIGECGRSSENRPDFKNNHYSNWLSEILENLKLKHVSIIGCSLGAWIALDFSIKHPEKVKKLVLLATAGVTQVKASTIFWIIVTSITGKWGFNKLNKMVYGNLEIDKQVLEFASLIKEHFKPRTEVLPVFTDDQLKQIQASTLFIGGENDCFYNSQKTAMRLYGSIEKFKYLVLKNTGHVLVNQTAGIVQFLNEEPNET